MNYHDLNLRAINQYYKIECLADIYFKMHKKPLQKEKNNEN